MSSVNRFTPLPSIPDSLASGIVMETLAATTDNTTHVVCTPNTAVPTSGPKKKPAPKLDLSSVSIEELFKELEIRIPRLLLLDNFSTSECTGDARYLQAASKYGNNSKVRDDVGKKMTSLNVVELFRKVWTLHFSEDFVAKENDPLWENVSCLLVVMWNMTDKCATMCQHCLTISLQIDVLQYLNNAKLSLAAIKTQRYGRVVKGLMGILHNMLHQIDESRQPIREQNAVEIIQRYRKSDEQMISCKALILQGFLLTEEENEALNSDENTFVFLRKLLVSALKGPEHRSSLYGFSSEETVVSLNKLAANDNNKTRIVKTGFLPLFVQMLQPEFSAAEQTAAINALWIIAFKCPNDILQEPGCVEALKQLSDASPDETVRNQSKGALWILEGKDKQAPENAVTTHSTNNSQLDNEKHVFISYQWDSKPTILMICNRLKAAGFKIWIDVESISGSVLEAMAEAVENSAVVLICLTHKYKESPNCRTEGEYTFRRRQPIIPLRVEERYTPDGWLGALCGNNVIYDFSVKAKVETSFRDLIKNIAKLYNKDGVDVAMSSKAKHTTATVACHQRAVDVSIWQSKDVDNWLQVNNLQHLRTQFSNYDGPMLEELMRMKTEAPEAFYSLLKDEKLSLKDILLLNCALKKLY